MNNNIQNIADEITQSLTAAANVEVKEKVLRLTSGALCIGVTVPDIRKIALVAKKDNELSVSDALELADVFFQGRCHEEILAVVFILGSFPEKQLSFDWTRIEPWFDYLDNWETCDQLSTNVAVSLINKIPANFSHLIELAKDGNFWKRRFAAATAANCNHGKFFYPEETLAVCKLLLSDEEPMVTKAVGWALREVYKKAPDIVRNFLESMQDVQISKKIKSELRSIDK